MIGAFEALPNPNRKVDTCTDHFFQDTFISKEKKGSLLSVFFIPESEKELEREILKDLARKILILSFSEAKWLLTGGEGGCAGTLRLAKRQR